MRPPRPDALAAVEDAAARRDAAIATATRAANGSATSEKTERERDVERRSARSTRRRVGLPAPGREYSLRRVDSDVATCVTIGS